MRWRDRRIEATTAAAVIDEAEAVVRGWSVDPGPDDRAVPKWGLLNTLAHATWADLHELAGRTTRDSAPWSGALTFLAWEIRSATRDPDRLLEFQRKGLIPLELAVLGGDITPPASPRELVALVQAELHRNQGILPYHAAW